LKIYIADIVDCDRSCLALDTNECLIGTIHL